MDCLTVQGLSKNFGGLMAVNNVTFNVETGKRLVIIGPNGAGKTTLFNLISGELSPSHGKIYLFGRDVTHTRSYQRAYLGLARTFQITQLFPNLTVLDNILLGLQGLDKVKFQMLRSVTSYNDNLARAQQLLEEWGLQEQNNTPVKNLSHGEQRKVEIILALTGKPKLMLLDEPTAGLSPAETEILTSLVLSLSEEITIILIEHDMDVAFAVAEYIIVLHQGQLVAEGTPEEIKANPTVNEIYLGVS